MPFPQPLQNRQLKQSHAEIGPDSRDTKRIPSALCQTDDQLLIANTRFVSDGLFLGLVNDDKVVPVAGILTNSSPS